ncbi:MAG: helix-turn-helix domain-containing protein [Clostridia bacterium]|nr:helix-turn-helix domain-containing protein [Clostridia bacterium]
MLKISKNIAALRKQAGITQEDLANRLNVSNQAVSKWEAGKCCPDIEILPELAAFFGVSIDELLLGECQNKTKLYDETKDPLVLRTIKIAQEKIYISTSILQRSLNIGYNTAKRVIEDMCKCGYLKKDTTAPYDRYTYTENTESDS